MKNFINISDLSKNDLRAIIDGAKKRKSERGKIPNSQPDVDLPCLLYTSPSPRDRQKSRMPSSA